MRLCRRVDFIWQRFFFILLILIEYSQRSYYNSMEFNVFFYGRYTLCNMFMKPDKSLILFEVVETLKQFTHSLHC